MTSSRSRLARTTSKLGAVPIGLWVVGWLSAVEIGLRSTSLPRLCRLLGVPIDTRYDGPGADLSRAPALTARERRRLRVLAVVAARWPFGSGPCLRQSLVAGRILRRHGPRLRLGAAPAEGGVLGHAWVELPGGGVVGRPAGFPVLAGNS